MSAISDDVDTTPGKVCIGCHQQIAETKMYWRILTSSVLQTQEAHYDYYCSDTCFVAAGWGIEPSIDDEPEIELLAGVEFDYDILSDEYSIED